CSITLLTTTITNLSLHDALPIYKFTAVKKGFDADTVRQRFLDFGYSCFYILNNFIGIGILQHHDNPTNSFSLSILCKSSISYGRSEEHTSELQSRFDLVCRLLLE